MALNNFVQKIGRAPRVEILAFLLFHGLGRQNLKNIVQFRVPKCWLPYGYHGFGPPKPQKIRRVPGAEILVPLRFFMVLDPQTSKIPAGGHQRPCLPLCLPQRRQGLRLGSGQHYL